MTDIFNERELAMISESEKRSNELVRAVETKVAQINWILGAVVIVFFVGFLTMVVGIGGIIWSARQVYTASYNEYRTTIQSLKDEARQKNEENTNNKFQKIQDDIDNLRKNKYPVRQ